MIRVIVTSMGDRIADIEFEILIEAKGFVDGFGYLNGIMKEYEYIAILYDDDDPDCEDPDCEEY